MRAMYRRQFLVAGAAFSVMAGAGGAETAIARLGQRIATEGGTASEHGKVSIRADFAGGNIKVASIEGDAVFLSPDPRGGSPDWFYWYFAVAGAGKRKLTFRFPRPVIGVRGPGVSVDGGLTWAWLGTDTIVGDSFTYTFPADSPEVRFSVGMPYVEADFNRFLDRHKENRHLRRGTLERSEQGREVELLYAGDLSEKPRYRSLITCRHHCCEMMASYTVEGIAEALIGADPLGDWFQKNMQVLLVPFMDKDGVENGDQGKGRSPHDHNRDYKDPAIYASVRALRALIPRWAAAGLDFALDIHCPTLRDGPNEELGFIATPFPENWARVERYCGLLESARTGPLPYRTRDNILYGQLWNAGYSYADFDSWAVRLAGQPVTSTLEVPYANARGEAVTPGSARALGRDLAVALRLYFERGHTN